MKGTEAKGSSGGRLCGAGGRSTVLSEGVLAPSLFDLRRSNSLSNSSSSVNLEKLSSPKGFQPDMSGG